MESNRQKIKRQKSPREKASLFSAATFLWTLGIFWKGSKRDFQESDLYEPLDEHSSAKVGDIFEKYWNEEISNKHRKKPSLLRVILRVFGFKMMIYGVITAAVEILRTTQPLLIGGLIRYFSPGSSITKEEAYWFASGVILWSALTVSVIHPVMMGLLHEGMKMRIACCSLIYRKALKLSKTALGNTTAGQVVNLLSNDVNRFDLSIMFIPYLWIGPLQTICVLYFMWDQIGVASLFGLAVILIFIPFQGWLGRKSSELRLKTAFRTDERVRLMNEIITGIQVIKMYTWEKPFAKIVSDAREKELRQVQLSSYVKGTLLSFIIFHSRLSIFCSIFAYVLLGNEITAEKVFVVTSFYNVLRQTMTLFFPQGIANVAEVLVSIKRLQTFLLYEETILTIQDKVLYKKPAENGKAFATNELTPLIFKRENVFNEMPLQRIIKSSTHKGVDIRGASARWTPNAEFSLNCINLSVEPGKLTAVIGSVGAGKTSLLHAILGELPLIEGSILMGGNISYASQEPWLFAGSVRQNILFGLDYNRVRYKQVVKVCALMADFEQLPYGDKTVVGERGVVLSGGQRARINLARAVYKSADIYLLDDPLSAVDTHVGKHLFQDCITGFLENKTCILVTHQLQYLTSVDHVVFMENGKIKVEGDYTKVRRDAEEFTRLISSEQEENPKELIASPRKSHTRSRLNSFQSASTMYDETAEPQQVQEIRSKGTLKSAVYYSYFKAGGSSYMIFSYLLMLLITQFLVSGGDYWITYWVNLEEFYQSYPTTDLEGIRNFCLSVFSIVIAATVVFGLFRTLLFFYMSIVASRTLHNDMFNSVTRATMRFFNTNSSGQILNRFSKDMGSIDEILPSTLIDCFQIGFMITGVVIVVAFINYVLVIPTIVVALLFYYLRLIYLSTSRSIKRLEGVTRSPVFAHLNASLQGLTTIRAFQAQAILEKEFDHHQDLHSSAFYTYLGTSRAFGYWLDLVCVIYISIVTYSFLTLDVDDIFGGSVGLAITQSMGLTGMFQWGMRQSAELENQMTSVERVLEYTKLESEPALKSEPDKKPPKSWPEVGRIVFSRVFMSYVPDEPPVLKNLCFVIEPKEKIGIVGRTGAGKSSLISALFRLTDFQGEILIDDINIDTLGLHDLRSKISIIPQEPVLFSGTIRKNLDPFDEYPDNVLWKALEEVELKDVMIDQPSGLNSKMSEGGSNFSVGQRQLVCLARAIVQNNKILIMDEATANVDPQTDSLIQSTIRRKFIDCTVLTIAHRLHTVMDSDKILVLGQGCILEYDHPYILLQDSNSVLNSMIAQMGQVSAERLSQIAAENFERKIGR